MIEIEESAPAHPGSVEHVTKGESGRSRPRRILLVDDHATARELLKILLEEYSDVEVVGEASDGEEAVAVVELCRPDIILMDIHLPRLNGVEATRRISRKFPNTTIIGISAQYTPYGYNAMITAGASAFVRKEDAAHALRNTIDYSVHLPVNTSRLQASKGAGAEICAEDIRIDTSHPLA